MNMYDAQMGLLYQHEYHPLAIGSDPKGKITNVAFRKLCLNILISCIEFKFRICDKCLSQTASNFRMAEGVGTSKTRLSVYARAPTNNAQNSILHQHSIASLLQTHWDIACLLPSPSLTPLPSLLPSRCLLLLVLALWLRLALQQAGW